jgi:hypothetical protein
MGGGVGSGNSIVKNNSVDTLMAVVPKIAGVC